MAQECPRCGRPRPAMTPYTTLMGCGLVLVVSILALLVILGVRALLS